MRILVIQITRLGDILLTLPTLQALRRQYPQAEIDLVVRNRFRDAVSEVTDINAVYAFDTGYFIGPSLVEQQDTKSLERLSRWCEALSARSYDKIINLSFSPSSSYISSLIAGPHSEVSGYTRHTDGFFNTPDDASAYFYAQVGIGRGNRFHVGDLFAEVAGVELRREDWGLRGHHTLSKKDLGLPEKFVALHIGASHYAKTLTPMKWNAVVSRILTQWEGSIVLIGDSSEKVIGENIVRGFESGRVINKVGRTRLSDLYSIIGSADAYVGGDSGPLHIASLTQVPIFNVSTPYVNFWETGPKSRVSRILFVEDEDQYTSEEIGDEILRLANNQAPVLPLWIYDSEKATYVSCVGDRGPRSWEAALIRALYLGEDFPLPETHLQSEGLLRIYELSEMALGHCHRMSFNLKDKMAAQLLERGDEVIKTIGTLVPSLAPLVSWFEVEKLRLGNQPIEDLLRKTTAIYGKLRDIASLYNTIEGEEYGRSAVV